LAQWKFKHQDFYESQKSRSTFAPNRLQSKSPKSLPHLLVIMKSKNFASSPCQEVPPLHFNQHHTYIFSPRPLAALKSLHQPPCKAMIHTTHKESPLSSQDCAPSVKPAHEDPSIMTYKTTKQTKNKKTRKQLLWCP
jgi:hypothetical protein